MDLSYGPGCQLSSPCFLQQMLFYPRGTSTLLPFLGRLKIKNLLIYKCPFALQPASALALVSTMAPVTVRQGSVCAGQDLKDTRVTSVLQATLTTPCASVSVCPSRAWVGTHSQSPLAGG